MSRVAVVTGGASGVGRSVCEHLARAGLDVGVLDINADGAAEVAEEIRESGVRAHSAVVDVGDRDSIETAFDGVRSELGPIEVLVTAAAVAGFVSFQDITTEIWDRVIRVNLTGTFHCIQLAIPDMVEAGWGRIVTISSAAGQQGSALQGDYSASKGGVISLTKAVAVEYAARGITANTVPPYIVDTPMFRKAQADGFVPADKYLERMVPQGRLGTPDDIGGVVAFLCSEGAAYLTGQVIPVNGGGLT